MSADPRPVQSGEPQILRWLDIVNPHARGTARYICRLQFAVFIAATTYFSVQLWQVVR